jgi:hypothetical protein
MLRIALGRVFSLEKVLHESKPWNYTAEDLESGLARADQLLADFDAVKNLKNSD